MGSTVSGFMRKLVAKKEARILIMGLDAAGKTTILYRLKLGEIVTTIPTIGFNVETIEHKNVSITSWDVGGRDKIRPLWRHYYQNTDALVFVVDSNDRDRIEDARDELHRHLAEDELKDSAVLLFANKQDLPNAMSTEEVVEKLGMDKFRHRQWAAYGCSAPTGDGLYTGLDWLSSVLSGKEMGKAIVNPISQTVDGAKTASGKLLSPATEWFKRVASMSWWASPAATS